MISKNLSSKTWNQYWRLLKELSEAVHGHFQGYFSTELIDIFSKVFSTDFKGMFSKVFSTDLEDIFSVEIQL
jgi:hypothetical protein